MWIQTWRYSNWRKELVLTFLSRLPQNKKKVFKGLFRFVVIDQALSEIRWNAEICKKKYKRQVILSSLEAIKNSLRDFNSLINH